MSPYTRAQRACLGITLSSQRSLYAILATRFARHASLSRSARSPRLRSDSRLLQPKISINGTAQPGVRPASQTLIANRPRNRDRPR